MLQVSDHPRIIIIIIIIIITIIIITTGGCGSAKANTLRNLINHKPDNDKTDFKAKDPYETNQHLWIKKKKCSFKVLQWLQSFNDSWKFWWYKRYSWNYWWIQFQQKPGTIIW